MLIGDKDNGSNNPNNPNPNNNPKRRFTFINDNLNEDGECKEFLTYLEPKETINIFETKTECNNLCKNDKSPLPGNIENISKSNLVETRDLISCSYICTIMTQSF